MTAIDTSLPSLTIVKSMTYRDAPEEFSNTYFFNGTVPASDSSWKALADAVIASEKTLYASDVEVVRAIGHEAGESVAVWTYDYEAHSETVAGTLALSATVVAQGGDTAQWVRWSTTQVTSRGKPIYLRSYFHPAYCKGTGDNANKVATAWQTAAQAFGDAWISGFDDGDSVTHKRGGPHGAIGQTALPSTYTTTRTLERRGRRP